MVVYAVGEPYALCVGDEGAPLLGGLVALIVGIDRLEHLTDDEVVATVLVEEDIASVQGCLLKVIYEFLLVECERIKPLHFVAKHLDISKSLVVVVEGCVSLLAFVA